MEDFKFIKKEAIADVAFEANGKTYSGLFRNAAMAVFETAVNTVTVDAEEKRTIGLENDDIEDLLYDFLSEIVYLTDKDSFVFTKAEVEVTKDDGRFKLSATLRGEPINKEKHDLGADVKAVTLHMFKIEETDEGYKAKVVLDV
jgi:SHS2 domain-containing protein